MLEEHSPKPLFPCGFDQGKLCQGVPAFLVIGAAAASCVLVEQGDQSTNGSAAGLYVCQVYSHLRHWVWLLPGPPWLLLPKELIYVYLID